MIVVGMNFIDFNMGNVLVVNFGLFFLVLIVMIFVGGMMLLLWLGE